MIRRIIDGGSFTWVPDGGKPPSRFVPENPARELGVTVFYDKGEVAAARKMLDETINDLPPRTLDAAGNPRKAKETPSPANGALHAVPTTKTPHPQVENLKKSRNGPGRLGSPPSPSQKLKGGGALPTENSAHLRSLKDRLADVHVSNLPDPLIPAKLEELTDTEEPASVRSQLGHLPPGRVFLPMNEKSEKPVRPLSDAEAMDEFRRNLKEKLRALRHEAQDIIARDGTKLDEGQSRLRAIEAKEDAIRVILSATPNPRTRGVVDAEVVPRDELPLKGPTPNEARSSPAVEQDVAPQPATPLPPNDFAPQERLDERNDDNGRLENMQAELGLLGGGIHFFAQDVLESEMDDSLFSALFSENEEFLRRMEGVGMTTDEIKTVTAAAGAYLYGEHILGSHDSLANKISQWNEEGVAERCVRLATALNVLTKRYSKKEPPRNEKGEQRQNTGSAKRKFAEKVGEFGDVLVERYRTRFEERARPEGERLMTEQPLRRRALEAAEQDPSSGWTRADTELYITALGGEKLKSDARKALLGIFGKGILDSLRGLKGKQFLELPREYEMAYTRGERIIETYHKKLKDNRLALGVEALIDTEEKQKMDAAALNEDERITYLKIRARKFPYPAKPSEWAVFRKVWKISEVRKVASSRRVQADIPQPLTQEQATNQRSADAIDPASLSSTEMSIISSLVGRKIIKQAAVDKFLNGDDPGEDKDAFERIERTLRAHREITKFGH